MALTNGRHYWLAIALAAAAPVSAQLNQQQGTAPARGPDAPKAQATAAAPGDPAQGAGPIIPDSAFDAALPTLSGDINAPLEPMPAVAPTRTTAPPVQVQPVAGTIDTLPPAAPENPELAQPLQPLATFDSVPLQTAKDIKSAAAPEIRYDTVLKGLGPLGLEDEFKSLSALREGKGKAANATQVAARAREDEALAVRLMKSLGYYDGTAVSVVEAVAGPDGTPTGALRAVVTASPGLLYHLSSVDVTVTPQPVVPPDLITRNLPLKVGDPIEAARIQGAEANVSLVLPQQGYPFVKVGDRDILLDDQSGKATGAYTLPVDTGPRSRFGQLVTTGDPVFGVDHLNVFPRFKPGDLYDSRKTDDLRDALVATGLFSGLAVEPQRTGRVDPDGTEAVDLLVRQTKGPARSLAGSAGYSTGQGFKAEGSWTHRNLFPPEGAFIGTAVAGTQEQGLSATFRRSNAGKRDKTFIALASASHTNYDAFEAYTATVSARWSYVSTPIWQKRFTYYYGGELVGTNESVFDFAQGDRVRRNYGILALPGQVEWDTSDSLLNPTRGYRLRLNLSPEGAVSGAFRPYVRTMVEGVFYYPVSTSLVIAGRAKAGSIQGIERDDLAPSRRYYGGGGGSVRGYGYQRLGPLDPQGNPVGGRSLNEFSIEARYRFGNFGIVPFLDAGNSYASSLPTGSDLKFGAGIGGRFYTNFGPLRLDVATPLNKRPGDSRIALYISIGQAY